jgi:hypothetical protein
VWEVQGHGHSILDPSRLRASAEGAKALTLFTWKDTDHHPTIDGARGTGIWYRLGQRTRSILDLQAV